MNWVRRRARLVRAPFRRERPPPCNREPGSKRQRFKRLCLQPRPPRQPRSKQPCLRRLCSTHQTSRRPAFKRAMSWRPPRLLRLPLPAWVQTHTPWRCLSRKPPRFLKLQASPSRLRSRNRKRTQNRSLPRVPRRWITCLLPKMNPRAKMVRCCLRGAC